MCAHHEVLHYFTQSHLALSWWIGIVVVEITRTVQRMSISINADKFICKESTRQIYVASKHFHTVSAVLSNNVSWNSRFGLNLCKQKIISKYA